MKKKKPVYRIRLGKIEVAVLENRDEERRWFSWTLEKHFFRNDAWENTTTFLDSDATNARLAIGLAEEWIAREKATVWTNGPQPLAASQPLEVPEELML